MSRSLHATSTDTETDVTTLETINNMVESNVVVSNNKKPNNNKKLNPSMSSSQIPVLSKVRPPFFDLFLLFETLMSYSF